MCSVTVVSHPRLLGHPDLVPGGRVRHLCGGDAGQHLRNSPKVQHAVHPLPQTKYYINKPDLGNIF